MNYEYIIRSAFECNRLDYRFADVGFCRLADCHPEFFVAILECALIALANKHDQNEPILRNYISIIDNEPTLECAESIIIEMNNKNIIY